MCPQVTGWAQLKQLVSASVLLETQCYRYRFIVCRIQVKATSARNMEKMGIKREVDINGKTDFKGRIKQMMKGGYRHRLGTKGIHLNWLRIGFPQKYGYVSILMQKTTEYYYTIRPREFFLLTLKRVEDRMQ